MLVSFLSPRARRFSNQMQLSRGAAVSHILILNSLPVGHPMLGCDAIPHMKKIKSCGHVLLDFGVKGVFIHANRTSTHYCSQVDKRHTALEINFPSPLFV